jgi:hypothetical protein
MYMMPAGIARIRRARLHPMMFGDTRTLNAVHAVRIQVIAEPFKASGIVREHVLEILNGERGHVRLGVGVAVFHGPYLLSGTNLP